MTSVIPCTCPGLIPSPASPPNTLKRDWSTDCMVVALFFAAAAPLERSSVILAKLCWALLIFPAKLCANSSLQLLLVSFRVPVTFENRDSYSAVRLCISPACANRTSGSNIILDAILLLLSLQFHTCQIDYRRKIDISCSD